MSQRGSVRVEQGAKRVRVMLGGEWVADTTRPLLVWEKPYYPTYYIPVADLPEGILKPNGTTKPSPSRGPAAVYDVHAGDAVAEGAAYRHVDSPIEEIRDAVAFDWRAMDHWFEESEEVYVHPRDPYKRVDILRSDRAVRIEIDGTMLAETSSPTLLFETSLPMRIYIPKTDVRMELLEPTQNSSECPYKGVAEYWSFDGHENVAWSYPFPTLESVKIAGLVSFYNERVDVYLDGELQEQPKTPFS